MHLKFKKKCQCHFQYNKKKHCLKIGTLEGIENIEEKIVMFTEEQQNRYCR